MLMKKLTTLFLMGICATSFSQPTLNQSDVFPSVGNTFTYYIADSTASPGSAGANQNWDFSTYWGYNNSKVELILNPSTTANGSGFPSATIADSTQDENTVYYSANATAMVNHGYVMPSAFGNLIIAYDTDPEDVFRFPFTYGTTYTDTYSGNVLIAGFPAPPSPISGSATVDGDGYGTLKLPFGQTFTNVLRVKTDESATTNITGLGSVTIAGTIYRFYDVSSKMPLISFINSNISGAITMSSSIVQSQYPLLNSLVENEDVVKNINLFPNPTKNVATFQFELVDKNFVEITVYDAVGREVEKKLSQSLNVGKHNVTINADSYPKGAYFIQIKINDKWAYKKLIVE